MAAQSITEIIADIVLEWTEELVRDMRTDLDSQTRSKRNQLSQSIAPSLQVTRSGVSMEISLEDYYEFVDLGVNGVQGGVGSPFSYKSMRPSRAHALAIADWIGQAGIEFKGRGTDKWEQARLSMAYGIATNIKKRGLKPKPFFNKNLTEARINDLSKRILDATGIEVELALLNS